MGKSAQRQSKMPNIIVSGLFDDIRSRHIRFLEEASRLGNLYVFLWVDENVSAVQDRAVTFPENERLYFLNAIRYVDEVVMVKEAIHPDRLPYINGIQPDVWVVSEMDDTPEKRAFCKSQHIGYQVIPAPQLDGFPKSSLPNPPSGRKKVIVTGCYDWLHSGHIRFFEEVSALGNLFVSVGNDANIRTLKGSRHPFLMEEERLYMVQAIRYVSQAFIATGYGYLDVEPEIATLKPDIYAVNEDGDRPEKRAFCAERGIDYVVLERLPKDGLPSRQSTYLRGF